MANAQESSRTMTRRSEGRPRGGVLAMPRRRGVALGLLLVLLGIWGAIIPFVGPYFNYRIVPDSPWAWSMDKLWLSILPGVAVIIGGLMLIVTSNRATAALGAWLALAGGAWFVVGTTFRLLWTSSAAPAGQGSDGLRFAELIGYFYGLGVVIVSLAAFALARVVTRSQRDVELLANREIAEPPEHPEVAEPPQTVPADVRIVGVTPEPVGYAAVPPEEVPGVRREPVAGEPYPQRVDHRPGYGGRPAGIAESEPASAPGEPAEGWGVVPERARDEHLPAAEPYVERGGVAPGRQYESYEQGGHVDPPPPRREV